jgi:hypothetical protein
MTATRSPDTTAPLAHSDVIVLDYLAALWAESDDLSPELRDELMNTVAEYIALRRTSVTDPLADPEQIVGRLGPPEALVASVRRGRMPTHLKLPAAPPPRPAVRTPTSPGPADATAIGLLMAGTFVLPVLSPLAGMMMVSGSPRWSAAQKGAAWVLVAGSMLGGLILALISVVFMYDGGAGLAFAYLTMLAGAFVAGVTLLPGLIGRRPVTG